MTVTGITDLPQYTLASTDTHHDPLWTEWMLANGLGGYAMSSTAGINTRRYHGLLVAAMHPPVERVVALSAVVDRIRLEPDTGPANQASAPSSDPSPSQSANQPAPIEVTLTPFHFRGAPDRPLCPPVAFTFSKQTEATWTYTIPTPLGSATVEKTLYLYDNRNAVALRYHIHAPGHRWRLALRPLVALRDFHSLLTRSKLENRFQSRQVDEGVLVATREAGLHLSSPEAVFRPRREIWRQIEYIWEERRGVDCIEHLMSPGEFASAGLSEGTITLTASVEATDPGPVTEDRARRADRLSAIVASTVESAGGLRVSPEDQAPLAQLAASADEFVVRRGSGSASMSSIIAGYPWFSDWGRDTMISLPGLMLVTGRYEEALRSLRVFGANRRRGLIPNRFDDYSGPNHYNTVDASLWFLHAASEYERFTQDRDAYLRDLAPACLDIIDNYRKGTDEDIGMDPDDALIFAGSPTSQLTWMDAQRDGVTFTPRFGKAVEINALWHHGLVATANLLQDTAPARAHELRDLAQRVHDSFEKAFSNGSAGLYDRLNPSEDPAALGPRWQPVAETRPNQIFAASLEHSPLSPRARAAVVKVVRDKLLTPHGLRTLAPGEPNYVGRLQGSMFDRDAAYHNGTVWPWLLGPFVEAVLRLGSFSPESRAEARALLRPLIDSLTTGNTVGGIAEIFDGDHTEQNPQRPDGCIQQAWSVAETLRVLALVIQHETDA